MAVPPQHLQQPRPTAERGYLLLQACCIDGSVQELLEPPTGWHCSPGTCTPGGNCVKDL